MLPAADVDADSDARRPLQTVYVHGLRVASLGSSVISEIIVSTAVVFYRCGGNCGPIRCRFQFSSTETTRLLEPI
jgi:hypothetical protein